MKIAVSIVAILLVIAVVTYFMTSRHPEETATHEPVEREGSALFHGDVNDRPGGPGAEADGVAGAGQPVPGPSAEQVGGRFDTDAI